MFTGLVVGRGTVLAAADEAAGRRIRVDLTGLGCEATRIGDSVALSGVCCTVIALADGPVADFFLSTETVARTWFGMVSVGDQVNVERCLRAGDPLGGHIVQGHVDGTGVVVDAVGESGGTWRVRIPEALRRYCVVKGSITLDGVSLTIAAVHGDVIEVAVIPHTAEVTTLGSLPAGRAVNVEVDVLAKHVERLLEAFRARGSDRT